MSPEKNPFWGALLSYAAALDTKSFGSLSDVFHEDACADHSPGPVLSGRREIIELMERIHAPLTSSAHRLTNFRVLSENAQTAICTTYVDAILVRRSEGQTTICRDIGVYKDTFSLRDGNWRIAHRRYERVWRESRQESPDF
jgi:ketosteroid isomerase-like protein